MSEIRVDNIVSADGSTAPSYTLGVKVAAGQTITNLGDFTTSGNTTLSGPVTFGSGARITGVTTFADSLNNVNITGISTFADGARITGVVTFVDGVSGLNVVGPATFTQGATVTGICTFQNINVTAGVTTFTGNVSVGGTLTYEDVTNIDSLGIITARSDVKVGRNFNVTGISTFHTNSTVHVGAGITIYANNSLFHSVGIVSATGGFKGDVVGATVNLGAGVTNYSGIVSATRYYGDGSQLTGIVADKIFEGNTEVETIDTGSDGHIKFTTDGIERVRITDDGSVGKVGLNTTTNFNAGVLSLYGPSHGEGTAKGQIECKANTAHNFTPTGGIIFSGHHTGSSTAIFAGIRGFKANNTDGDVDGCLGFDVRKQGAVAYEAMQINEDGDVLPGGDNTQDLGSSAKRWANVYTGDLHLSNEGRGNDIDGTSGAWTMQEGSDDLFLINNKTGKKYKFNLTEVS